MTPRWVPNNDYMHPNSCSARLDLFAADALLICTVVCAQTFGHERRPARHGQPHGFALRWAAFCRQKLCQTALPASVELQRTTRCSPWELQRPVQSFCRAVLHACVTGSPAVRTACMRMTDGSPDEAASEQHPGPEAVFSRLQCYVDKL